MGRFTSEETKDVRAEWWEAEEHAILRKFNYGDRQRISAASTIVKRTEGGSQVEVDMAALNLKMLELGIASWTLRDDGGKLVKLTRTAIERLTREDGEYLLDQITAFNERRTKEDQDNFRGAAGAGAEGERGAEGAGGRGAV